MNEMDVVISFNMKMVGMHDTMRDTLRVGKLSLNCLFAGRNNN